MPTEWFTQIWFFVQTLPWNPAEELPQPAEEFPDQQSQPVVPATVEAG